MMDRRTGDHRSTPREHLRSHRSDVPTYGTHRPSRDHHERSRDDSFLLRKAHELSDGYVYSNRSRDPISKNSIYERPRGQQERRLGGRDSRQRSLDSHGSCDPREDRRELERHTLPRSKRNVDYYNDAPTSGRPSTEKSRSLPRRKMPPTPPSHEAQLIQEVATLPRIHGKENDRRTRTGSAISPWNRCASDSTLDVYPERHLPERHVPERHHVRFANHRVPEQEIDTQPRDGCLLLGREDFRWTKYATTFYIKNRLRQCKAVKREILRDNFSSFLYLPVRERKFHLIAWHFIKSMPFVMVVWTSILVLQASKCALPSGTRVLDFRVSLGLTIAELLVTCVFIAINIMSARDKFTRAETERLDLEQVSDESNAESAAEFRVWIYLLIAMGILSCAFIAMFVVVLAANDALGWTILTNGVAAVVIFAASRLTHDYLDRILARIHLDHHKIALFEAMLHVGKQYLAVGSQHRRKVRENVKFFIQSLQHTRRFGRPDYIAYPAECQWDVITGIESGV